jgi:hypothetical protein
VKVGFVLGFTRASTTATGQQQRKKKILLAKKRRERKKDSIEAKKEIAKNHHGSVALSFCRHQASLGGVGR